MAASPRRDTIMVSAIPTVTSSSCSTSSGPVSSSSSFCVNSGFRPPKSGFFFRSPPDFPLICSFPRAGPSRSDTYAHPSQGRLPIECIHLSTRTGSCKELSHSASFCRCSRPHRLIFMLVRQFAGNFSLVLCVSKNAIFRTFIGEKIEKRACNSSKSGMLYPTKALRWIHGLLRAVLRSAQNLCS